MQSKLSIDEFRTRLRNNTEIGSLKVKLSSFRVFPIFRGTKLFYGWFDDTSFRLTTNSENSPTIFIVKGTYRSINNVLEVDYTIESNSKFQSLWVRFAPLMGIVAINIIFLFFARGLRRATSIVNLFLLIMIFYSRWVAERRRKKLEQKFVRIFEIK